MKTAADAALRTLSWVEPPAQSERQFDAAPSTCSVEGGGIESRWRPTGSYEILDHCDHP